MSYFITTHPQGNVNTTILWHQPPPQLMVTPHQYPPHVPQVPNNFYHHQPHYDSSMANQRYPPPVPYPPVDPQPPPAPFHPVVPPLRPASLPPRSTAFLEMANHTSSVAYDQDELLALESAQLEYAMTLSLHDKLQKGCPSIHRSRSADNLQGERADSESCRQRSHSPIGFPLTGSNPHSVVSTVQPPREFTDSVDGMPRLFLVAPLLDDPFVEGTSKPFRILVPCQAPSYTTGAEDAIHMTEHDGYTVKNPRDFVHNNRHIISLLDTIQTYLLQGASIAMQTHGYPRIPGDLIDQYMSSLRTTAHNRIHLNGAGIGPRNFYSRHVVVDNHQRAAMTTLLRAATVSDSTCGLTGNLKGIISQKTGRTLWVCYECYDKILASKPIIPNAEFNVTLTCSASLIIFTKTLSSSRDTKKVIIQIDPAYFEAPKRTAGAQFNAICDQFNGLGETLSKMRLTFFEFKGNSTDGTMYAGLKDVLKCSTLQRLVIRGVPLFLQSGDISNSCRLLTQLVLDDVLIDTAVAANNLQKILWSNTGLSRLCISHACFTIPALAILISNRDERVRKRFERLSQLKISYNDIDAETAKTFVMMAISKGSNLKRLDISGNRRIGDEGCCEILALLRSMNHHLQEFKVEDTGVVSTTASYIVGLPSRSPMTSVTSLETSHFSERIV
ncbi:hypothetical protein EDD21DRAFT_400778 [Dissophora ornata]|nr:hypothetical protein EDD21DRAFT_400778 [Dissophora ornata]